VRARGQGAGRLTQFLCVAECATALKARVLHLRAWNHGLCLRQAAAASAATDDDDEVVIVKVIFANEKDHTRSATAEGAAGTTARVLAGVSAAVSAAGVFGYTGDEGESDEDDGEELDEWDWDE